MSDSVFGRHSEYDKNLQSIGFLIYWELPQAHTVENLYGY